MENGNYITFWQFATTFFQTLSNTYFSEELKTPFIVPESKSVLAGSSVVIWPCL